jgi:ATP-dependent DNA ligase
VFLRAFDLIKLNGDDLRREPLISRKTMLASVISGSGAGLQFNDHLELDDGDFVFKHACKLGLEGIVSKRKDSPYTSGRSRHWIKLKNPNAPAVKRKGEEDWRRLQGLTARRKAFAVQRCHECKFDSVNR